MPVLKVNKKFMNWLKRTPALFPVIPMLSMSLNSSNGSEIKSNNIHNNTDEKQKRSYFSLRDDYILYNQYQYNTGLCWDFSATKSLETSLMLNTNEMYDFSEASITINDTGNVGGGAWFDDYDKLISKNGIAYESDFKFGDLYYVPNKGAYHNALRNYFNKYTHKNFRQQVRRVDFETYDFDKIKKHITKNGSLFVAIRGYKTVANDKYYKNIEVQSNSKVKVHELVGTGRSNTHAVSIIGWDDNYKATDGTTGAWLFLIVIAYIATTMELTFFLIIQVQ
ncbi:C1 family peptidase [Mycoplasmopsis bovis]|uniref:C1 family peptidase n=1 Tax=Mycoplasmopsis bovis TaxID=28903 RepID=UPI001F30EA30|nr:C1 family peptidase [Mycoplasmopsis bovis]